MTSLSASIRREWRFLTSHSLVLLQLAHEPQLTVREIAAGSGLTERQTHRVLDDLVGAGYVARTRVGRRNRYRIDESRPMRHSDLTDRPVGALIAALAG
jgi:DNA-binding MarR family transcriptional regulator